MKYTQPQSKRCRKHPPPFSLSYIFEGVLGSEYIRTLYKNRVLWACKKPVHLNEKRAKIPRFKARAFFPIALIEPGRRIEIFRI